MKIFLSWSGDQSRAVALALRQWIPDVLQAVHPWMSAADISAGARWNREIDRELGETSFGVLCLTSENLNAPWLMFEAGALAKTIDQARVCPFLLDLEPSSVPPGPLAQFQAKRANRLETLELIQAINSALGEKAVPADSLERAFGLWWPRLEERLEEARRTTTPALANRSVPDVLAEVLNEVRSISRRIPTRGAAADRVAREQRTQIARYNVAQTAVNSHEEMRRRNMEVNQGEFAEHVIKMQSKTERGMATGTARVKDWPQLDDDALAREVVAPIVQGLIADYDKDTNSADD